MTDDQTTEGQPRTEPGRILDEHVQIDVSNLSDEQVLELRRRLAEFAKGIQDPAGDFGVGMMAGHSSHEDNDGWA